MALGLVVAAASLVDFALSIICDIPYSYIGELASLYLFLAPHTFLHLLLEMKYLRMAKKNVNLKDDEEMLGVICFIN